MHHKQITIYLKFYKFIRMHLKMKKRSKPNLATKRFTRSLLIFPRTTYNHMVNIFVRELYLTNVVITACSYSASFLDDASSVNTNSIYMCTHRLFPPLSIVLLFTILWFLRLIVIPCIIDWFINCDIYKLFSCDCSANDSL